MNPPRVVVVTGAGRGIGAAAALELARAGLVPVLFVRSPQAAQPVVRALQEMHAAFSVEACDVADHASVTAAMARTLERHGCIDAAVNNAGQIEPIGKLAATDPAQWKRAIEVNLLGAYNIVHAALPAMVAARRGLVLNVSSGAAHTAREGWSAYCSSKAGLFMLTRAIAVDHEDDGVLSIGFQPGVVDTDMQVRIRASGINEISRIPRANLAPADRVARAIAWLCREEPRQFQGRDITMKDLPAEATQDDAGGPERTGTK